MFVERYGDKMKNRDIPLKNYVILFVISVLTVILVFYLVSWYNASKEYYQNNSILSEYLSELKSDEISSYLIDNPEVVIYYASAKDSSIKDFEKEFKKLIEDMEIKDDIIYIDSSKTENINFVIQLNKVSDNKIESVVVPNLIYIKDSKVNQILNFDESTINKRDVRNFLIKCGVITND